MRLKFKPNVHAPRGTTGASSGAGTSAASEGGVGGRGAGGEAGGGSEAKRRRKRQKSRGDESAGTEGESSSELETSETTIKKRQRRASERSGPGAEHQATDRESRTADKSLPLTSRESDRVKITETTDIAISEASQELVPSQLSKPSQLDVERSNVREVSSSEIPPREVSSAGQVQSTAAVSGLRTLSTSLTRSNNTSVAGGKGVPRLKKKLAPKVVSSRPRRAAPSTVDGEKRLPESDQDSLLQREGAGTDNLQAKETRDDFSEHKTREDTSLSHGSETSREDGASSGKTSLPSGSESTNQTSDEAISNTLNEVLHNAHTQEPVDVGLAGIVPNRLGLIGGPAPSDGIHDNNDAILITSQQNGDAEVEVRTESASVGENEEAVARTRDEGAAASSVNSASLVEDSFVYQTCSGAAERESQSPCPTRETGQTSQSGSPSSSQETSSPTAGSAGQRSQRSLSRASSLDSEAAGDEGEKGSACPTKSGSKGKKGQKRKKKLADSASSTNEPKSQGTSLPPSKKQRLPVVKVRDAPDRTTMTMRELIYYNPTANPMSSSMEERKKKKDEVQSSNGRDSRSSSVQPTEGSRANSPVDQDEGEEVETEKEGEDDDDGGAGRIVPTLKIGVDGKIIIDEESMVMETSHKDSLEDMGEVVMDSASHTTSSSYRHRYRVARWTKEETSTFFKALSQVGTDFTMMTLLIPMRSRRELKNKFKREEKTNPQLISRALRKT